MKKYQFQKNKVIILPVKLAGPKGEKWTQVIFDTGATYSMFPPSVLQAVGHDLRKPLSTVKIITASSVEYVPMIKIPKIEIFGINLTDVVVVSHLLPPTTPAQGLIGISTLNHFDYELNFSDNTLIIKILHD